MSEKIVGTVVIRRGIKMFSVIQVRTGTKVQPFLLWDSDVCYIEPAEILPGQVVRFEVSDRKPKKPTDYPYAVLAEVYESLVALQSRDAADAMLAGESTASSTEVSE